MPVFRFLILVFIFTANMTASHASAVTQIQRSNGGNDFGGTTYPRAFTANVYAGHIGVVGIMWESSAITVTSVTGSRCTYTLLASTYAANSNVGYSTEFAYCIFTSSGAETATAHFSATVDSFVSVYELTAGSLDQVAANSGDSNSPGGTNTVTTSADGAYGIAILLEHGNGSNGDYTAGAGWVNTGIDLNIGGGASEDAVESTTQTSAGSLTGNFVGDGTNQWVASLITFKPPGARNIIQGYSIISGRSVIN